jgi:tRNA-specific adenosine deaminase 2
VGCVLVHKGTVIAKGMNATNVTRNGTRHAEFMALSALFALPKENEAVSCKRGKYKQKANDDDYVSITDGTVASEEHIAKGHLYPYGQKFHPAPRVAKSIIKECVLYVTVEPCVMCASLLRQLGIKKVYFGAVNDKFGGAGGVFRIHQNTSDMRTRLAIDPDDDDDDEVGHGGNIEPGFEVEGGWGRDEAVGLLRRFYVQENGRAPVPRKKEGRAARLAALEREAAERISAAASSQEEDRDLPNGDFSRVPGGDFMDIGMGSGENDKENMPVGPEKNRNSDLFALDQSQAVDDATVNIV